MNIDHFTFFPERTVGPPPPGAEERWIVTADGQRLHAWFVGDRSAPRVLLWSHGNAGNIDSRREVLMALAGRGLGLLAYDYRGYGKSTGSPHEAGVYLDASAAFDSEVARGRDPRTIVCFGESLGGAVSTLLADRESRDRLAGRGRERLEATPAARTSQLLELYASLTATAFAGSASEPRPAAAG